MHYSTSEYSCVNGPISFIFIIIFLNNNNNNNIIDSFIENESLDWYTYVESIKLTNYSILWCFLIFNYSLFIVIIIVVVVYVTFNLENSVLINCLLKTTRSCASVSFNNIPVYIRHVDDHRHLGEILTYYLSWSKHIRDITMRVSWKLGVLRRQSCKFSRSTTRKNILVYYMIMPILKNGCFVFDNCSTVNSMLLDGILRRAAVRQRFLTLSSLIEGLNKRLQAVNCQ